MPLVNDLKLNRSDPESSLRSLEHRLALYCVTDDSTRVAALGKILETDPLLLGWFLSKRFQSFAAARKALLLHLGSPSTSSLLSEVYSMGPNPKETISQFFERWAALAVRAGVQPSSEVFVERLPYEISHWVKLSIYPLPDIDTLVARLTHTLVELTWNLTNEEQCQRD